MPLAADTRGRRVLVVDERLPDPGQGAGYGRMYDTVLALAAGPGLRVDFHAVRAGAADDPVAAALRAAGINVVPVLEDHLCSPEVRVDVVVVSRPHTFARCEEVLDRRLPGVPVVYDAEAVYYRREEMQARFAGTDEQRERILEEAARTRALEERLFARADEVVCISEAEAAVVRQHARGPVTVVGPWLAETKPTLAGFAERRDLGLVAGWKAGPDSPNADGLLWFAREVLPVLRARVPWARLLVTGADPPRELTWLEDQAVRFVGRVEDLQAFYEGILVAISPVRFGAGVKLKSVEALQSGVPLVATAEGAAGLEPALEGAFFASDDAETMAAHLEALLLDEAAWNLSRAVALRATGDATGTGLTTAAWPEIISRHLIREGTEE